MASSSYTQQLETRLAAMEIEVCKQTAEEFVKDNKFDEAIAAIKRAWDKNPNDEGLRSHHACYLLLKLAFESKDWYAVLGVNNRRTGIDVIKKHYDGLKSLFRQDVCSSAAAPAACKLIDEAWHVLSDPKRRTAYDFLIDGIHEMFEPQTQMLQLRQNNNNAFALPPHNTIMMKQEIHGAEKRPAIAGRFSRESSPESSASSSPAPRGQTLATQVEQFTAIRRALDEGNRVIIITPPPPEQ